MAEGDTIINAIIGAIVTIVLSLIPFSPVAGGVVAGYLQGPDTSSGVRVGALSGAFSAVPMTLVILAFGGFIFAIIGVGEPNLAVFSVFGFILLVMVFLFLLAYSAVLGALGGYLGSTLKNDDVI